jgi:2-keto-4-pentenoate hydratase/2-oxohepta-3-ene-1,7-dioic acid hydratase in catechol pathway
MKQTRRTVLKQAGAMAALAVAGGVGASSSSAAPKKSGAQRGAAKGLTLFTFVECVYDAECPYRLGVKTSRGILDVATAARTLKMPTPTTMDELLQGEQGPALNALVDAAMNSSKAQAAFLKEDGIQYGPLVTHPEKIVCIGLNYRKHAEEIGSPIPKQPVLFSKFNTTLNRHHGTIKLPVTAAKKFDYEVELVIVMGKEAHNVSEADALSYVAGYATGNDFTARDLQLETGGQWLIGKTPDQFAPLGPYMVTADQVDPDNLKLECRVNGETRQSSNTSDMIFNTRQLISYVSRVITLRAGDIIFTGTPQGVIQGKPADQRVWLKPGDKIACSVEKLGELRFDLV